jgi:hypothetical protein
METATTEKQMRYNAINNLSNILWSKLQKPSSKYKKMSIVQLEFMYEQLSNTDRALNDIYEEALKLG